MRRPRGETSSRWTIKKEVSLFEVIQLILLVCGFYFAIDQVRAAREQIAESNRVAYRSRFDAEALQLKTLPAQYPSLMCIYKWDLQQIDEECATKVFRSVESIQLALGFTEVLLEHIEAVTVFAEASGDTYFTNVYRSWANELADDPTGIVRFVILTSTGCNTDCGSFVKKLSVCPQRLSVLECNTWLDEGHDLVVKRARQLDEATKSVKVDPAQSK